MLPTLWNSQVNIPSKTMQLDAKGGPAKTNTIQMKKLLKLMLISIPGDLVLHYFGFLVKSEMMRHGLESIK